MAGGKDPRILAATAAVDRAEVALGALTDELQTASKAMAGRPLTHAQRRVEMCRARAREIGPILAYARRLAEEEDGNG